MKQNYRDNIAATIAQLQTDYACLSETCETIADILYRVDVTGITADTAQRLRDAADYGLEHYALAVLEGCHAIMADVDAARNETPAPLSVCEDCYAIAANGTDDADPMAVARYTAAAELTGDLIASCPDVYGDCQIPDGADGHYCDGVTFSSEACEYCGSTLAGSRQHAALASDI
jgi:hypothetical protein